MSYVTILGLLCCDTCFCVAFCHMLQVWGKLVSMRHAANAGLDLAAEPPVYSMRHATCNLRLKSGANLDLDLPPFFCTSENAPLRGHSGIVQRKKPRTSFLIRTILKYPFLTTSNLLALEQELHCTELPHR